MQSEKEFEKLKEICQCAASAKYELQKLTEERKNQVLLEAAAVLVEKKEEILSANAMDMEKGREKGMKSGLLDRLLLNEARIEAMAEGIRQVAKLADPIGEVLERFERPNGLVIEKRRVPLGVIGIIFESRPNVTADAFALCFKTGNAVVLKGGSDALYSNMAITKALREALCRQQVNPNAVSLIESTDRSVTAEFMKKKEYVDVLIPRGGAGLIRNVVENSTIPVIETGTGNCHIYVDKAADIHKVIPILINAKTQRIGVCNACESLVIHKDVKEAFLPEIWKALKQYHVEMRGDKETCEVIDCKSATEEDFGMEYLDYIISIRVVSSVEEAIAHINTYNTGHSDVIITEDQEAAEAFLNGVDAACVYVNASSRFTDGFEFGFGAEIGISTQKLHARGPMGLKELTSYKYCIRGNGQIRK